jgi:hypothetical protein
MLLTVLDSTGIVQTVITNGQEAVTDNSGTISATGVSQIIAVANSTRSGFFLQNVGANSMWFNELGSATETHGSVLLIPGASVSAPKNYPVCINSLNLIGTSGEGFTLKQW